MRGEWRVEAYHARRDGAYCEDIRTRRCDENVTGALMLARTMALYFFSKSGMENCQAFKEEMQLNPDRVFDNPAAVRPTPRPCCAAAPRKSSPDMNRLGDMHKRLPADGRRAGFRLPRTSR